MAGTGNTSQRHSFSAGYITLGSPETFTYRVIYKTFTLDSLEIYETCYVLIITEYKDSVIKKFECTILTVKYDYQSVWQGNE